MHTHVVLSMYAYICTIPTTHIRVCLKSTPEFISLDRLYEGAVERCDIRLGPWRVAAYSRLGDQD